MIRLLDDETINKIAAGEVVERPASVAKELVENAIDAGARNVIIEVHGSGVEFMRVTDDGCGMTRDDALLAFERHATSKISRAEDLFSISTLGFRGEALPSIASVSRVELLTRPADSIAPTGTRIEVEGGRRLEVADAGAPPGTTVIVRDLFFNTPARFKYLRSDATEFRHVCDLIMRLALAHPEVAIRFSRDGRPVLTSPGRGDQIGAIAASFGTGVAKSLIRFAAGERGMEIMGFVGRPDSSRTRRDAQCFFVNGRSIWSAVIQRALDSATAKLVPQGRHAAAFIWLNIDPSQVDVNVHPTKREVKFEDETRIYRVIFNAIHSAVQSFTATPGIATIATLRTVPGTGHQGSGIARPRPGYEPGYGLGWGWPERRERWSMHEKRPLEGGPGLEKRPAGDGAAAAATTCEPAGAADVVRDALGPTRLPVRLVAAEVAASVLAQFKRSYIVAEAGDTLILIDQHAAHERVIYEGLLKARLHDDGESQGSPIQPLLIPVPIQVTPVIASFFEDNKNRDELRKMGFDIEPFGRDALLLRAVPAILGRFPGGDSPAALAEAIQSLGEPELAGWMDRDQSADQSTGRSVDQPACAHSSVSVPVSFLEHFAAQVACKAAVKAGTELAAAEMQQLVVDLFSCDNPYSCPHGRPTLIRFELDTIEKSFRRR